MTLKTTKEQHPLWRFVYMNPMDGQHLVETRVFLTCHSCGRSRKLKIPHSTKNKDVVAKFRKLGWKCTKNGFRTRCPRCAV